MAGKDSPAAQSDDREFIFTRVFAAPRKLVFKVWTEAEHLAQWWGPKSFTIRIVKLDLRPGGIFHYTMQPPKGPEMWAKFVYREIVAPERIVFVNAFSDEKGGLTRNPWIPAWPLEVLTTVTFTEQDGKTTLTLRGGPINATDDEWKIFVDGQSSMRQGFGGTFDRLADYLAKA